METMEWTGHVTMTAGGRAVVGSPQVPVEDVLEALAQDSVEVVLARFDGLSEADIRATLAYASELVAALAPVSHDDVAAVTEGLSSIRAGRTVSLDDALRRLHEKLGQ